MNHSPNRPSLIRRIIEYTVTHTGSGPPTCGPKAEEWIELSQDGGLVTHRVSHERFYGCGCSMQTKPPGGACKRCGRVSCAEHFVTCEACGVPLCLEHARWRRNLSGRTTVACEACDRSRRIREGIRSATGLFVEFERKDR